MRREGPFVGSGCGWATRWVGSAFHEGRAQLRRVAACFTAPAPAAPAVNRRMDEWVPLKNFNLDTVIPPLVEPEGEGGRCVGQAAGTGAPLYCMAGV